MEEELQPLKRYGKAVLAYGSILTQWFIPGRSDIDVAIVTMERDEGRNIRILLEALGKVSPNKYDVRVFELLPLHVKSEVIKNHRVIHGDQAQLGEYLHLWRKLCKHYEVRRRKVGATVRDIITGRKRLKKLKQKLQTAPAQWKT